MKLVDGTITLNELKQMSLKMFGKLVKGVVDIEKEIMVVDASMHADEEKLLLENGSKQEDLWGINLYPELDEKDWIEFDSMINLRPGQANYSRSVEDEEIKKRITEIVHNLIKRNA